MKRILYILLLFSVTSFSQTITVDNTTNSPADLVNLLLQNSCVEVSNISISSNQSVGYFNRNGSSFPINEGIILRSGNILDTQGLYTGSNMGSTTTGGGTDAFLQNLSNTSSGTTAPLTDLSFLQFDFTPISSSFNFDFLFASNDYGQFQCLSNDIFAIELTDLLTNTTTNIAVIPSTSNPISIKYIKNASYNNTCSSTNPELFSVYNVTNPAASTLNMRGHSVVLNASGTTIPNNPYRLKMVIADYINFNYDSAVFISRGSFANAVNLGPDQIICSGDTAVLEVLLDNTYNYQWFQDGNPVGGNTSTFTVNGPGTYTVEITKGSCFLTDTIVFNDLPVSNPIHLQTCNTGAASYTFDLTTNNEAQLGIDDATYNLFYYTSMADVVANNSIAVPTSFSTPAGQTIFVKIFNTITNQFCDAVYQFDLLINATVNATQPIDVELCETPGSTFYLLSNLNAEVLSGQSGYTVLYYNLQADAVAGNGATITQVDIPNGATTVTVWIRMQDSANSACFDVTSVNIIVNPLPPVDELADVVECSSYVLPPLVNGNYFTGPNGSGTPLFAGDIIDEGTTYYIYNGLDANGCFNESTFNATFIDEYELNLDNCGSFTIPGPPYNIGAFYTAAGGPTGSGTLIPQGTIFTNTTASTIVQTVFYYAEVNNVFCRDQQFDINIHPVPLVDDPADVIACDSYILPSLTNGSYNTSSDGTGITLNPGDVISVINPNFPRTYYVVNSIAHTNSDGTSGSCSDFNGFVVNLVDTTQFTTVSGCESYTLPAITFGGYYTAPMGGGTPITNFTITTSQIVYYFANTTLLPNCTDNLNYDITINPLPNVDTLPGGTFCGEYILPPLTNGNYYTLSGGPNVIGQIALNANQIIDLTGDNLAPGTYYIYNQATYNNPSGISTCSNETSFTINITPFPGLEQYINTIECSPYTIPAPTVGQVYTEPNGPNGIGTIVNPSTTYNSTQTFYLYYVDPTTGCKIDKKFTKIFKGINLPIIADIKACDTFTLDTLIPDPLTHLPPEPEINYTIEYHLDTPNGPVVLPSFVFDITNAITPRTIWLTAVNSDGYLINCPEVRSFTITVSETPVITPIVFPAESCGTYVLPTLPTVGYTIGYFSQPNGVGPITNLNIINNTGAPGNPPAESLDFTYYVYAMATNNPDCHDEQAFSFTVHPLLDLTLQGGIICVDPITNTAIDTHTIHTGLNPALFNVNWYLNGTLMGTGVSYTASQAGVYDVEFVKLTPDVGTDCNYRDTTVTIIASSPAIASFTVSQEFDTDNTFITVNISAGSLGNYLFQLEYPDGTTSAFQASNVFNNLEPGEYFVNIYDTLGNCSPTQVGPIYIINYPNYFTPNGDGVHDTWNILDLEKQPNSVISIFDRYGKLLKQITPAGIGWDGKYNGKDMPSSDYWFTVEYISQSNQKGIFKSHFSLKR
ncbi:T9SS type B sorting domain-containing protein [Flavobacterium terrigena]|nr:T9SS type B sorting domain-containing protein [Flavobacterium terrigena]